MSGFTPGTFDYLCEFLAFDPDLLATFTGWFTLVDGVYVLDGMSESEYEQALIGLFGAEGDYGIFLRWDTSLVGSSTQGSGTV